LLSAVKSVLPPAWSEVQTRGYISGLVTRLSELDVLNRVWAGREVHYEVSNHGALLLDRADSREVA
jgi:hypothetical protein